MYSQWFYKMCKSWIGLRLRVVRCFSSLVFYSMIGRPLGDMPAQSCYRNLASKVQGNRFLFKCRKCCNEHSNYPVYKDFENEMIYFFIFLKYFKANFVWKLHTTNLKRNDRKWFNNNFFLACHTWPVIEMMIKKNTHKKKDQ